MRIIHRPGRAGQILRVWFRVHPVYTEGELDEIMDNRIQDRKVYQLKTMEIRAALQRNTVMRIVYKLIDLS